MLNPQVTSKVLGKSAADRHIVDNANEKARSSLGANSSIDVPDGKVEFHRLLGRAMLTASSVPGTADLMLPLPEFPRA
jgi:hypothetical protein